MKQPILMQRENGAAAFVTRYHQRGETMTSAGDRYEFDVTRQVRRVEADTVQGLTEALIDTAYAAGEPNIAQWLSSKRLLAAEPMEQAAQVVNGGQAGAAPRTARIEPRLEQQDKGGWTLRLSHADEASGYVRSAAGGAHNHVVTGEMARFRQETIEAHKTRLTQLAWRERQPEAMAFLNDLAVSHVDDLHSDYGVRFNVERAESTRRLDLGAPVLRPIPGGRAQP